MKSNSELILNRCGVCVFYGQTETCRLWPISGELMNFQEVGNQVEGHYSLAAT